ncbi:GNAT family N-acetyltransferase [Antarctobacter sp.]|uniref:GNAT family N-acetyltransferase n=1 Tax=Antarctobacter sp. TaxID=1872577 RepID=UPI002B2777CC|nr:GNAT family N-acetyltransferase [Antarctobacter sp.]
MAGLLNEIIEAGGTTAIIRPVTADDLRTWMTRRPERAAWHLAENEGGAVMGFQWIEPADYLPVDAAEIATFARLGQTGLGIGSALFRATEKAARTLGYQWINANIRADNAGGLAYYQSRGFEDYGKKTGVRLEDGQTVDKVLKRYDL